MEQLHETAFSGQPLGNISTHPFFFYFQGRSMIVPWSALDNITPEILRDFHQRLYTPGSNFPQLSND